MLSQWIYVLYLGYVDDIFIISESKFSAENPLVGLNTCRLKINLTIEDERCDTAKFLDVSPMGRTDDTMGRSSFRRCSWTTGQHVHLQDRNSLVRRLFNRPHRIRSDSTIQSEMKAVKETSSDNRYPQEFINQCCRETSSRKAIRTASEKPAFLVWHP